MHSRQRVGRVLNARATHARDAILAGAISRLQCEVPVIRSRPSGWATIRALRATASTWFAIAGASLTLSGIVDAIEGRSIGYLVAVIGAAMLAVWMEDRNP